MHLWDLKSEGSFYTITTGPDVEKFAISPDSRWLAFGRHDGIVEIRHLDAPMRQRSLLKHPMGITVLEFSPEALARRLSAPLFLRTRFCKEMIMRKVLNRFNESVCLDAAPVCA